DRDERALPRSSPSSSAQQSRARPFPLEQSPSAAPNQQPLRLLIFARPSRARLCAERGTLQRSHTSQRGSSFLVLARLGTHLELGLQSARVVLASWWIRTQLECRQTLHWSKRW